MKLGTQRPLFPLWLHDIHPSLASYVLTFSKERRVNWSVLLPGTAKAGDAFCLPPRCHPSIANFGV